MARNILIYSDGTGQVGGIAFDENRSNIYKMYRATRVAPDSCIDPNEQIAYYDAGLGSRPPGAGSFSSAYRRLSNFVSQATGLGLTANIIDCYQMIIRYWRPGDRIFLFGFSRGAYTVRCVAGVLANCGVPTRLGPDQPLTYDPGTLRKLAKFAVKRVYQHTPSRQRNGASKRQGELLDQRIELARQFREKHGVDLVAEKSHYPYFIGVFDTVASIASRGAQMVLFLATLALVGGLAAALWATQSYYAPLLQYFPFNRISSLFVLLGGDPANGWHWFFGVAGAAAFVAGICYVIQAHRFAPKAVGKKKWRTFTFNWGRMSFEDKTLNDNVPYARHAISIDENRASFKQVGWGDPKSTRPASDANGFITFQQMWFAGNHSDIGGSYAESESRLSDIALKWMIEAATTVKDGIKIDPSVLRLYPSFEGMQHCQRRVGFPILTSRFGITWPGRLRVIKVGAPLHPSVTERAKLTTGVLLYDHVGLYRPEALRDHPPLTDLYAEIPRPVVRTGWRKFLASFRLDP